MQNTSPDVIESPYIVNAIAFKQLWDVIVMEIAGAWVRRRP
jgi:hypothetical protein